MNRGRGRRRGREFEAESMPRAEPDTGLDSTTAISRLDPKLRDRHLTEPPSCPSINGLEEPLWWHLPGSVRGACDS